jgi:5'-nucleotidase
MRFSSLSIGGIALALSGFSNGINILMSNDDGFGSANLRQLSQMLLNAGHDGKSKPPLGSTLAIG